MKKHEVIKMYCVNCGAEIENNDRFCFRCGNFIQKNNVSVKEENNFCRHDVVLSGIRCMRCNSGNVIVQLQTEVSATIGKSETIKKGVLERVGNKVGRASMIMATGGLWALTPKRSKYKNVSTYSTKNINKKIAICQNCGNSWYVQ